jgi:outer membrane immunogenic protein
MRQVTMAALMAPFLLTAGAAAAADLPNRYKAPAEYYSPAPVANWQGFYVGLNAGYGWGAFTDGADWAFGKPSGGQVGFTAGYNYILAPNFLVGVESDFDFAGMKDTRTPYFGLASASGMNDLFTLRGRVGYTVDRALFYVTGGFAGARNTGTIGNLWTGFAGQQSTFQTGWALGAGVEYLIMPNLSVKAEYLYTSVGSDRYFDFSPNAIQASANVSQIRAGANYHF